MYELRSKNYTFIQNHPKIINIEQLHCFLLLVRKKTFNIEILSRYHSLGFAQSNLDVTIIKQIFLEYKIKVQFSLK